MALVQTHIPEQVVRRVQAGLMLIRYIDTDDLQTSGVFDEPTIGAIGAFQVMSGLDQTGVYDEETHMMLCEYLTHYTHLHDRHLSAEFREDQLPSLRLVQARLALGFFSPSAPFESLLGDDNVRVTGVVDQPTLDGLCEYFKHYLVVESNMVAGGEAYQYRSPRFLDVSEVKVALKTAREYCPFAQRLEYDGEPDEAYYQALARCFADRMFGEQHYSAEIKTNETERHISAWVFG